MAINVKELLEEIKAKEYFVVIRTLEEAPKFNGEVPFDMKYDTKTKTAMFQVLAASHNEASEKVTAWLNRDIE